MSHDKMISLDRFLVKFAEIMDERMRALKVSDRDVAIASDMDPSIVSRIRVGLRSPGLDSLIKIARGFLYSQGLPSIPYPDAPRPVMPGMSWAKVERKITKARRKRRSYKAKMRARERRLEEKIQAELAKDKAQEKALRVKKARMPRKMGD